MTTFVETDLARLKEWLAAFRIPLKLGWEPGQWTFGGPEVFVNGEVCSVTFMPDGSLAYVGVEEGKKESPADPGTADPDEDFNLGGP